MRVHPIQKFEPQNFLCHSWLSEERLLVGTDQGRMLLFEGLLNTHNFVIIKLFACRFLPCIINSQYLTSMFNKYVKCRATCIV